VRQHPLDGARAKLDRAHHHLIALQAEWLDFLEGEPYSITFETNPGEPHKVTLRAMSLEDPPLPLGVTLGDFAHNLRSALDQLVCRFIDPYSLRDDLPNAFPIYDCETAFIDDLVVTGKKKLPRRILEGINPSSDEWALIEGAQPYKCGAAAQRHPLSILRRLSNRDKHRALSLAYGYPDPLELQRAVGWDPDDLMPLSVKWSEQVGQIVIRKACLGELRFDPAGPEPDMHVEGVLPFQPAFDLGAVTTTTVDGLKGITKAVQAILDDAQAIFASRLT